MNYTELNLNEKIQKGLAEAGYVTCTPVQEKVLQNSIDGSDLYVQSQTGTGKTAAFLVTIMQEIIKSSEEAGENESLSKKNALILVPTRELAVQVEDEAKKLGNPRVFNTIIIGLAAKNMDFEKQDWLDVISETVPQKTVEINQKAFLQGYEG